MRIIYVLPKIKAEQLAPVTITITRQITVTVNTAEKRMFINEIAKQFNRE